MQQLMIVPAGCQSWSAEVVKASHSHFGFCSTLGVYIYSLANHQLQHILAGCDKTILSMTWNPHDENQIAVSAMDSNIVIWDLASAKKHKVIQVPSSASNITWSPLDPNTIAYSTTKLFFCNIEASKAQVVHDFSEFITCIRWCPSNHSLVAIGTIGGHIYIIDLRQKKPKRVSWNFPDSILDIQFDPLSTAYIIASSSKNELVLIDIERDVLVTQFERPGGKIKNLSWHKKIPGCFLTTDEKTGTIRVWNVASKHYVDIIHSRDIGFHAFYPVPSTDKYVCGFKDGSVGVFDFPKKRWEFLSRSNHFETIFDCEFNPSNKNLLATASYDKTIKFWDVVKMDNIDYIGEHDGHIYGISWSPGSDNLIASVTYAGSIYIWDSSNGTKVSQTQLSQQPLYRVSWNQSDPSMIAAGSKDGHVFVIDPRGTILRKFKLPQEVYGVDWSPFNSKILAVGCYDGLVRIYDISKPQETPKILKGHSRRSFNVSWNPLVSSILASGSDDHTIKIWNTEKGTMMGELVGHQNYVRALVWNPTIPYILLSGSWDGTIRIWDTRNFSCIDVIYDHNADVYGLDCHPDRPFFYVSTSRDNTIRLWSLDKLIRPIQFDVIFGKGIDDHIGTLPSDYSGFSLVSGHKLYSPISREIYRKHGRNMGSVESIKTVFDHFKHPIGILELLNLLDVSWGNSASDTGNTIQHRKNCLKLMEAHSNDLASIRPSKSSKHYKSMRRAERMKLAALSFLKAGQIQRYCDLMIDLGEWEKAIAAAPAVSIEYWKLLSAKYADQLALEEKEDAVPYFLSSGNAEKAAIFYSRRGDFNDAFIISEANRTGRFLGYSANPPKPSSLVPKKEADAQTESINLIRMNYYYCHGSPIISAACALSNDDISKTLQVLLKANEIELASIVSIAMNHASDEVFYKMALISEKMDRRDLVVASLKKLSAGHPAFAALLGRVPLTGEALADVYKSAGLFSQEAYLSKLTELLKKVPNIIEKVNCCILARDYTKGLEVALNFMTDLLSNTDSLNDLHAILVSLSGIPPSEMSKFSRKTEVMAFASYVGLLRAMNLGYVSVISHLAALTKKAVDAVGAKGIIFPHVTEVCGLFSASEDVFSQKFLDRASKLQKMMSGLGSVAMEAFINGIKQRISNEIIHPEVILSGSHILRYDLHAANLISAVTRQRIRGPAYVVDLRYGVISLPEAIMLADVNPFSPVLSGDILNPY